MSDWLHGLPVVWLALLALGVMYLASAAIYATVRVLAKGERARAFKSISAGLLSPLGVLFGLVLVFTASEVWNDNHDASDAVNREAIGLRAALALSDSLPEESRAQLHDQIRRYVQNIVTKEWPMMAAGTATLGSTAPYLSDALVSMLAVAPGKDGPQGVQAAIASSLEVVLDARRQRILISQRQVDFARWLCIAIQALCTLFAIAMIHADNPQTTTIAMGIFATAVGASLLLILAYDRPFVGSPAVGPEPLLQATAEQ